MGLGMVIAHESILSMMLYRRVHLREAMHQARLVRLRTGWRSKDFSQSRLPDLG